MTKHTSIFIENTKEVIYLIQIAKELKDNNSKNILYKSCIVFIVTCWETFIEDIIASSYSFLIDNLSEPDKIPKDIKKEVSKYLREEVKNELKIWELSGDGWKTILYEYKDVILNKYLGYFNTPKSGNIDEVMKRVLGYDDFSNEWYWTNFDNSSVKKKLKELIELRGLITHKLQTSSLLTKDCVREYAALIIRLAVITNNRLREFLFKNTGIYPWDEEVVQNIK